MLFRSASHFAKIADEDDMWIIYGATETIEKDGKVDTKHAYNSAFVCSPDGEVTTYQKITPVEGSWCTSGETPVIIDSIADLLEQFSSEYPNYELNLFYGSVSEIINGLENNKLDFGFIIENSNDILKDEYCSLSFQIKQRVITPGSIDNAVHPINTIEKPARVIWQNDINCMKGLFVEKLRDFSERFLLSATRPNGKKEEKVV